MSIGTIFHQYGMKAGEAANSLKPAMQAAPTSSHAAIDFAELGQASLSVVTGAGKREDQFLTGRFGTPVGGGILGRIFRRTESAAQAEEASALISTGIASMRANDATGAITAWRTAHELLEGIATKLT